MRAASLGVMPVFDEPPDFPDPLFPMMLVTSLYVNISFYRFLFSAPSSP
jgi:hypothetical protein